MTQIDSLGTFIGEVVESGMDVTKKGYPQWVARLKAMKKFIENPEELEHFQLTEPGYVDWSSFNEDMVAYLVLFNSKDEFSDSSKMLNYEQLQLALKWDGAEFDSLGDGSHVGKQLLFRIEHNSYTNPETGKTREGPQVSWIDAADAPPQRQLKSLDSSAIKGLTAKLSIGKKKPVAPAKPVAAKPVVAAPTKPGKPAVTPPSSTPATTPAGATSVAPVTEAATPTTAAASPTSNKAPKPPKAATTPPPPPPVAKTAEDEAVAGLAKETNQMDAWAFVCANKGDNTDDVIQDAWIAACQEVGENKSEDDFTGQDWAKVRDIVIRDCGLSTK